MPRNVEIKARLREPERQRELARRLADGPGRILEQRDRFFAVPTGRLKLREESGSATLIFYRRPDQSAVKCSHYALAEVVDAEATARLLVTAFGAGPEIRKERELLMRGRTRIHLDRVAGLGEFLELEVLLADAEATVDGAAEAEELLALLAVAPPDLIAGAYADLLDTGLDGKASR